MKKEGHPEYQEVLFVDSSTGHEFVCGTTLQPKQRKTFQGKEYPVCYLSVSSASHPFFTRSKQHVDAEGRVEKFLQKYAAKDAKAKAAPVVEAPEPKSKAKTTKTVKKAKK